MKIINCFLGKSRGGIEIIARDYAEACAELGFESELLSISNRNYTNYLIESKLPCRFIYSRGINPINVLHFIWHLKQAKATIVFLHGTKAIEFGTHFLTKTLCPSIRFIGVSHGVTNKKYRKLKYALGIADFLKDELNNLSIPYTYSCQNTTKIYDIPLSTDTSQIPVIGAIGRDSPIKGWDILFDALSILKKKQIPFHCRVSILKDNYAEQIRRLDLNDNVDFLGWVSDKTNFFSHTDIYCLPSRGEGMPLTVLEAMMHAKPVAASNCPGIVEILQNSNAGFIHPIEDAHKLAEDLAFLLTHPQERKTMGQNARTHILQNFNRSNLPNRLKKIIENVYTH